MVWEVKGGRGKGFQAALLLVVMGWWGGDALVLFLVSLFLNRIQHLYLELARCCGRRSPE